MSDKTITISAQNSVQGDYSHTFMHSTEEKTEKRKNIIYAGNLRMGQDEATQKKLSAQRKALKKIMDQYHDDSKVSDNMSEISKHTKELQSEQEYYASQLQMLKARRQELMDESGITKDSREEEELKLLEKSMYGKASLTEEELEQLSQMGPLSEYQKSALQNDSMSELWQIRLQNTKNGIENDTKSIISIQLELVKTHPMVDAQKEAAKIIEAAIKEVVGMLTEEAKDQFDEEQEKLAEETKKKQEEKLKEEERLQKLKEDKKKKQPDSTNSETSAVSNVDTVTVVNSEAVQQELLKELMTTARKQNMLEEDLKGLTVDELL